MSLCYLDEFSDYNLSGWVVHCQILDTGGESI